MKLMTPRELQDALAISERTMYRLIEDGELSFVRVRGQLRFRESVVERFIADNTVTR